MDCEKKKLKKEADSEICLVIMAIVFFAYVIAGQTYELVKGWLECQ
jgi:hypothetical protein